MKRIISFFLAIVVTTSMASAQFIVNDVGASLFYGKGKLTESGETVNLDAAFYGVSWYPRYILSETGNGSISVGVPVSLGFSGSFNSREGGNFSFGLDAPIAVDYNFGVGAFAEEEGEGGFGGFIGAGFGFTSTASSTTDDYNTTIWNETDFSKAKSYGPMGHAGIRFPIGQGKILTIRLSFKKGLEKEKYNFFGGSLFYRL